MSYAIAKATCAALEAEERAASARLNAIPGVGTGAMGLTPDHVKFSPEYREAREAWERAWQNLRRFNATFAKSFKAEIAADRRNRRTATPR